MADVVGVAASVLQIIQIGALVVSRIAQYSAAYGEVPEAFRHIHNRIKLLDDALRLTKEKMENDGNNGNNGTTSDAFEPILKDCLAQMTKLQSTIDIVLPKQGDSSANRKWKAIKSMKYDSEIQRLDDTIGKYMTLMSQHHVIANATQTPSNPKPPLKPKSTCPFERERDFVYRDTLGDIMARSKPSSKLAVIGIGGVGKSRLAIEYSYRVREASPQTWVFWVFAKDASAVQADFRKIAEAVRIPRWNNAGTDIFTSVREWLRDESNGPWVMIIDNVDDTSVLTHTPEIASSMERLNSSSKPEIRDFITTSQNGSILLTSRNRQAAQMITGHRNCANHIDLEEMTESEALLLFKSKLNDKVPYAKDEAVELVKTVDFMPLAISQIAANISLNYPHLTISKAAEQLKQPTPEAVRLLETSLHENGRDTHRSNSIVKTLHLTFQYLRERHSAAARLLSLMCLFDRENIHAPLVDRCYRERVVTVAVPLRHWQQSLQRRLHIKWRRRYVQTLVAGMTATSFQDDSRVLMDLALIKPTIGVHAGFPIFNMHRLVQQTTKRWLEMDGSLVFWEERYLLILGECFPKPVPENRGLCLIFFAHARQAVAYRPKEHDALQSWATLIQNVADFSRNECNYLLAEELGRIALSAFETTMGHRNEEYLSRLHNMGIALATLSRYKDAEVFYRKAHEGRSNTLGSHHLDTRISAAGVVSMLYKQEKFDEGDAMDDILDIKPSERKNLGYYTNPEIALKLFASGYMISGQYQQGARAVRRLCGLPKDAIGPVSTENYDGLSRLADCLTLAGRATEAETILRQVIQIIEEIYGPNHYLRIREFNRLGQALIEQAKFEEASTTFQSVVQDYNNIDGYTQRDEALFSMHRLVYSLLQQGKLEEAESASRRCIEESEKLVGTEDAYFLYAINDLAKVLTAQGRNEEALPLYETSATVMEKVGGVEHVDSIRFRYDFEEAKNRMIGHSNDDMNSEQVGTHHEQ